MKRAAKKLCGLVLAVVVALGGVVAMPLQVGAAAPSVKVNTTTIAFAGHEWVVIGDNSGGVITGTAGHVTLLQKNGDAGGIFGGNVFFNYATGYNNYTTGELYAAMQGIHNGFGTVEKDLVISRTLDDVAVDNTGAHSSLPDQYVWPLSDTEYTTVKNNGGSDAGLGILTFDTAPTNSTWWLRSPGPGHSNIAQVGLSGGGLYIDHVDHTELAVRPALILNLNSAIFTSDAAGGKSSVTEGNWSSAGALQTTDAIKLTLPDTGLSVDSATVTGVSGNTITFGYTASGTFNRLSAIVTDSTGDTVKFYGNLDDTSNTTGSASVTVPGSLAATDKLWVLVEQVNANTDATQPDSYLYSDFASAQVQLTRAAPTTLAGTAPTTNGGTDGKITGTTAEMEYSTNGTTWYPCSATETTGLAAGAYQVRYKAQTVNGIQAVLAGSVANVTVGEGVSAPTVGSITAPAAVNVGGTLALSAPSVTWNGNTGTGGWEVSANGSTGWTAFNPATTMTAAHNGQYLRYTATNSEGTGYSTNTVQITVNVPPAAPTITGPATMTLTAGYSATASSAFTLAGYPAPTVTPNSTHGGKITWNSGINKLDIAAGLSAGTYTVTLTAANGNSPDATHTFTLTVNAASSSSSSTSDSTSASSSSTTTTSESPRTGGSPQTGDTSNLGLWAILGLSSVAMLAGLLLLVCRRRVREK